MGIGFEGDGGGGGGDTGGAGNTASPEPRQVVPPSHGVDDAPDTDDGGEESGDEGKAARSAAKKEAARLKLKWRGEEREFGQDELQELLSDDYEHEFKGPGGEPVKLNRLGIERAVQQSHGALKRLQEYTEAKRGLQQDREWAAKDDGNRMEYLRRYLGVEDPRQWLIEQAGRMYQEEVELTNLAQQDMMAWQRKMAERQRQEMARQRSYEEWRQQQRQQQEQQQRAGREIEARVEAAVKGFKLEMTPALKAHLGAQAAELRKAGMQIDPQHLADMARQAYYGEMVKSMAALDDATLLKRLGPQLRERLRNLELGAAKAAKKADKQAAPQAANGAKKGPQTFGDFAKKYGL